MRFCIDSTLSDDVASRMHAMMWDVHCTPHCANIRMHGTISNCKYCMTLTVIRHYYYYFYYFYFTTTTKATSKLLLPLLLK